MSGFNFDAEDLELEDTLQDVNRFLQVLESEAQKELKAQREQTPTPVRWKKRDRHGFVIPKRPSSSKKSSGMPSGSEVLRQELLELLEDVVDDEVLEDTAVICEASSESAATDWEIRNKCGKQAVVRCLDCLPFPFLCEDCDTAVHSRFVLHNGMSLTGGFRQPLSELRQQMGNIHASPGRNVSVITINVLYRVVPAENFMHITVPHGYMLSTV
ncbi:unnamed protein product [Leuciscus chuanchicus]